jgi:RND family efflux transporter MFP subunit
MPEDDLSKLRIEKTKSPARRGKRRRLLFWLFIAAITAATGVLYQKGLLQSARQVQVANVQSIYPSQAYALLNASGYVVAQRKAAVASKLTGRLVQLMVEEGSRVKEGDVIARLENEDALAVRGRAAANVNLAKSNLREAKVELQNAARSFDRLKDSVKKGLVSAESYDTAQARLLRAEAVVASLESAVVASEAALKEADVNVSYASIRAPFDAVVLTKNADVGDILTPLGAAATAQASVVTIADMDSLQVEVDVSESSIYQVKVGQPCEIQLDALPDERFRGVVHMIVPTADRTKASIAVKVAFREKDPRILPEMSAKVAFLSKEIPFEEQQPVTAVPISAVIREGSRQSVFSAENGRAVRLQVTTGREFGGMIEIIEGLKPGQKVITAPGELQDNARIQVAEA